MPRPFSSDTSSSLFSSTTSSSLFSSITSSSSRETKSSRFWSIHQLWTINIFFMASIQLPFFLLLYILLSFLITNQNPKNAQTSIHGDETKWEVNCHLRLRRQSHVLKRCLTGSPWISVAVSAHPFLGGLEPSEEDAYWPRDVDHRRTGTVIFPIIYLKTFLPNYLCCVYVFLRREQLFKDFSVTRHMFF